MSSNFSLEFRGDHIHVELAPEFEVTPDTQDEFWNEIRDMCDRHDLRRVLVEGYVPSGDRDTAAVVDAGERAAAVPKLWLAFHLMNFVPNERSELFEVIAARKGIRIKFFSESADALNWLRKNAPG